jgi:hypothetical protein
MALTVTSLSALMQDTKSNLGNWLNSMSPPQPASARLSPRALCLSVTGIPVVEVAVCLQFLWWL